jgi:TolB-like protein/DNA-binding winged helix-turn-helix (wHTH) protein/Tfp pilus assembly protein PilF
MESRWNFGVNALYAQVVHLRNINLRVGQRRSQNANNVRFRPSMSQGCKYQFGPFELRVQTRELYNQGVKLKLRPQAYQVLAVLLEHAGECVTRDELQKRVWPSNTFVDFENGLNTAIKQLRASLNDSAAEPRYIETLPKLGYRVIVPVQYEPGAVAVADANADTERAAEIAEEAGTEARVLGGAVAVPQRQPTAAATTTSRKWWWAAAALVTVLAVVALAAILKWRRARPAAEAPAHNGRTMLAVLPFDNLTGDETQDYFSDGLTEEMIARLGKLDAKEFGVIARTSVMHYKHTSEKMDQIGSELGVQYVLEGSVRRDADKVRISAELIEVGGQRQLWAQEYDRELTNLLVVQAEIAQEISDSIELTLGGAQHGDAIRKAALTPEAYRAYDLYLKGLYFWNKRTTPGLEQASVYFQQAIAQDPSYAPAYAGLANSYSLMTSYSVSPATTYMPKARAAAVKALELDDRLPEAHCALALILENYDWDWNTAEKEFRRAIELNPDYATAHQWYAELLMWRGRFDEALRESEAARTLDPLSLIIATDQGALFYFSRQYDRSIEQFQGVLEMDPTFPRARMVIDAYVEEGRYADALAGLGAWQRAAGAGPWQSTLLVYVYGRSGQKQKARAELKKLEAENRKQPIDSASMAFANLGVGNKDAALDWLKKAYAQRSNGLTSLKVEPAYDPLRGDPRFQELLQRVGLAQ